jgi:hypothetical protein
MWRRFLRHRLAKGDRRRLENAIASVASGRGKIANQPFEDLIGIKCLTALQASHLAVTAMKLYDFLLR